MGQYHRLHMYFTLIISKLNHTINRGSLEKNLIPLIIFCRRYKPYSENDLVYLKESPDFCTRNTTLGSLGTQGRECKENSKGVDGCDLMCCGRGYRTTIETVIDRCNCKFLWCCNVICEECQRTVERNICLWWTLQKWRSDGSYFIIWELK